jgi:GT2 family glycosyltransferase
MKRFILIDGSLMNKPPIIGLTLNFRDETRTQRCVASLLSNGAEHVVVWDNSDDEGVSARSLARQWLEREDITLLVSPANLGFSAAVNRGIAWIQNRFGDAWVALINNDAHFLPGALSVLSDALTRQPSAMIAYPDIDHGGKVIGPVYYQRWLGLLTQRPIPGSALYVSGCALLIAPDRTDSSSLFDEAFFMYGEDIELGWRFAERERWCAHVPGVWVCHEGSASSGMGSEFYESRMVAAHFLLARALAHICIQYWAMLFGRFLMLTARAALRAWRYRSALPLRALPNGWRIFKGNDPLHQRARLNMASRQVQVLSSQEAKSFFTSSHAASTEMPAIQGAGTPGGTG